jgi:alpha-tubulin suppressor-like RCC1 family protein
VIPINKKYSQFLSGQVGNGAYSFSAVPKPVAVNMDSLKNKTISRILATSMHSLIITDNDEIYAVGLSSTLGIGANIMSPLESDVFKQKNIKKVIAGGEHIHFLMDDTSLYSWGVSII